MMILRLNIENVDILIVKTDASIDYGSLHEEMHSKERYQISRGVDDSLEELLPSLFDQVYGSHDVHEGSNQVPELLNQKRKRNPTRGTSPAHSHGEISSYL